MFRHMIKVIVSIFDQKKYYLDLENDTFLIFMNILL